MNEAVEQPAEQTAPVESATTETEAVETSQTPADASIEPKKVSESVPYERFKEVNDRLKALEETVAKPAQAPANDDVPELDPTVVPSLERWYSQKRETEKTQEFLNKHQEELKDPLLDGTVRRLMEDARKSNQYLDQEAALQQAKDLLESRINPQVAKAAADGVEKGQELARQKSQLGAIGEVGENANPDPTSLPSAEFAKSKGLKYVE